MTALLDLRTSCSTHTLRMVTPLSEDEVTFDAEVQGGNFDAAGREELDVINVEDFFLNGAPIDADAVFVMVPAVLRPILVPASGQIPNIEPLPTFISLADWCAERVVECFYDEIMGKR